MKLRVMIAGGGTGGHLFPGIAVAQALLENNPETEILFVGTRHGIEFRVVPQQGFRLETISAGGLMRMGLLQTIINLFKLPLSLLQSLYIVLRFMPHVAIGVGGYASGPAMLAAWLLLRPTMIIEQNSVPGRTNRILARLVKKAITSFSKTRLYFPENKIVELGNPVRPAFTQRKDTISRKVGSDERLHVLVLGGSQGAKALNDAFVGAIDLLHDSIDRLSIRHQTGKMQYESVSACYTASGFDAKAYAFIDDVWKYYEWADLLVCRAGATTCAELGVIGRPALFVPLPTAADDHQTYNAGELVEAGAAWSMAQRDFTPEALAAFLKARIDGKADLAGMAEAALAWGRPRAAYDAAELCISLAGLKG